jgi:carboxyl-terminal processing protease
VKEAFDSLKRANPNMKGVILDLRGNPGGLLNEAVNIVNIFVDKNNLVVNTKGKVEEWNNSFKTLNDPSDTKIPVVVLANSMSASASEIVSGCIQDYDRGVIVGQRTYGKGLVQVTKNLSYNTMLKVTTAKYYIPSGRCVQAINYAEHNPDGSVKHVPDSLKVAFKTKNGRQVWDGGGIDPDVKLQKQEMSKVAAALLKDNLIFAYATQYKLTHPSISDAAAFKLSDAEFNEFLAFVKSKNFTYETESEEKLEKLKKTAEEEKYFDAVKAQYEAIKTKLNHDKQQDMVKQKAEIVNLLEGEIVGRYFYVYGKITKNYKNDTEVAKAIDLIMHPEDYNEQLMAKK